jgi:hypothetical protein
MCPFRAKNLLTQGEFILYKHEGSFYLARALYLQSVKGTSLVLSFFIAVVTCTSVRTSLVSQRETRWVLTEPPRQNTRLCHLWLVNFYILIILLAEDI